ncbi:MAG: hypothetical protein ACOCTG_06695, partial [Bacteroidota bacterium]
NQVRSMLSILLAALLFAGIPATSENVDREDDHHTGEATEAMAPAHLSAPYAHPFAPVQTAKMWTNLAFGVVTDVYDDDGEMVPLGEALEGELTSLVFNIGGAYAFYRIGDMNLNGGVNFSMASKTVQFDLIPDQSSGFVPQNLTIFGEIERPMYSLRIGYLADLGSEPTAADERASSDLQNAFQFGASGQTWFNSIRAFGGIDYFLTLPVEAGRNYPEPIQGSDIDEGDIVNLHAGAGYSWGSLEAGLAVLFRMNREGNPESVFASGNLLSAAPYLSYAPAQRDWQVSLKGALQREYHDYGFAIAGRNDIAPRLGATMSFLYAL